MAEKLNADQEEAQFMARLVMAWNSSQDTVHQLGLILRDVGLLKEDGKLDIERFLLVQKKAKGE